ncbi:energy-coupling factor transporter transmembrane component T family protein [Paenibacillus alkalitolerans]|uniref:energy-coupling factor transporter transmembrane component T family protein n=1 Tax=Paenibacillus alkalitolerans TaxID=2799335 RepID=UPI0018F2F3CB|nr:energy-coupling factor transporter transmembrane component T [Paenibacillus alkalitolerans]
MARFGEFPVGLYVPGKTFLHLLDPRTKLFILPLYVAGLFAADTALNLGLHAAAAFSAIWVSRTSILYVLRMVKSVLFLVLIICLVQLQANDGRLLWSWGWVDIYDAGLREAFFMSVRFVLLIIAVSLFSLTTSPAQLAGGLESLLQPLRRLGFSPYDFAFTFVIALRSIPILLEEIDKLIMSRASRGADFHSRNIIRLAAEWSGLIVPLLARLIRRAEYLSTAMEARCFRGGEGRTRRNALKPGWRDGLAVCFIALLLVLTY